MAGRRLEIARRPQAPAAPRVNQEIINIVRRAVQGASSIDVLMDAYPHLSENQIADAGRILIQKKLITKEQWAGFREEEG